MKGETNLNKLLKGMTPILNPGEFVFLTTKMPNIYKIKTAIVEIKEQEGTTFVLEKTEADQLKLGYDFVASWITLEIHSSLEAVGLTAAFSSELAKHNISCNVIAGFYHDHIFVPVKDTENAMRVLNSITT